MEQSTTLAPKENTYKKFGIELKPALHRKIKVAAASEGMLIRDLVADAIEKFLAEKKPQ